MKCVFRALATVSAVFCAVALAGVAWIDVYSPSAFTVETGE